MKDIKNYNAPKYSGADYKPVGDDIYETVDKGEKVYVTSLTFVQEPEFDEEDSAEYISQYPLEDLLDKFCVYVSDFYPDLNTAYSQTCYQEFGSTDLEDVQNLRTIIGKHVYNMPDGEYVKLIIE